MLGKRSAKRGLFEADTRYGEFVGQRTFYGYPASHRDELFRDEDFAALYGCEGGGPSVPPSPLATALVWQTLRWRLGRGSPAVVAQTGVLAQSWPAPKRRFRRRVRQAGHKKRVPTKVATVG